MTKDCINLYEAEKCKLRWIFESSASRICLTSDLWTSIQNLGYMCLTAHYIDKDWRLQKKIINFRVVPTPHNGDIIAQAVEGCLLEWGIDQLCTLTIDNASCNDTVVSTLKRKFNKRNGLLLEGKMFHIRCFAHILNLIMKDGIDEVSSSIIKIREAVKYVRNSPSRYQCFKKCAEVEKITSKRTVCLDVPTRWNSTYLMLGAALEYQKAFERLEEKDLTFANGAPFEENWLKEKNLHKFLEHFYIITNRVSGSKYVTSNTYFQEVTGIQTLLQKWSRNENVFFSNMG
ncbi:zinc finger BED domain-containing protein RICESLEEPER 2-like [Cornus florida]|uniref:zinc finger BED domain-containing protein RICESLEEPER 2-like n=1 Tax=Cornus florida TaxID=4283 RepID=UPI0028995508|nr:zinc finger BED domain-containing protein RICESLEEPER 2-like [Cornus florida]